MNIKKERKVEISLKVVVTIDEDIQFETINGINYYLFNQNNELYPTLALYVEPQESEPYMASTD